MHEILDEQVFTTQPPGFVHPQYPHYVCKLNRALYGLKQAPHAQYVQLSIRLLKLGFIISKSDPSLFIYWHHSMVLQFLVYVDDIVLNGQHLDVLTHNISILSTNFPVKDLRSLHYFFRIECNCIPALNYDYLKGNTFWNY